MYSIPRVKISVARASHLGIPSGWKADPGFKGQTGTIEDPDDETDAVGVDLEQLGRDQIAQLISAKFLCVSPVNPTGNTVYKLRTHRVIHAARSV